MTTKEKLHAAIDTLPDHVTFDEALHTLYVWSEIEKGEQDLEQGDTLTHEQVKERMSKWLK